MNPTRARNRAARALLAIGALLASASALAVTDLHRLVWTADPATTMTIGWRQGSDTFTEVRYRVKGSLSAWSSETGLVSRAYQNTNNGVLDVLDNSFVKLTGLTPKTDYEFQICDTGGCTSKYMWFRTAPNSAEPITFIAGGDSRRATSGDFVFNDLARRNGFKLVAAMRPLFVLMSGDFSNDGTFDEWLMWLNEWQLSRSADGRMYPIVPAHGNHENDELDMVRDIFNVETPAGEPATTYGTYNALSVGGNMMRVWTLNTELEPGIGYSAFQSQSATNWNAQTAWLAADLAAHPSVTWKFANFHRPLRPHTSGKSEGNLRYSDWAPLFDQYDVDVAIDSDSHMVKYTVPVKYDAGGDEGFSAANLGGGEHGTVFIGEGSWGAPKRPRDDSKSWTLVANSFWQFKHITVDPTNVEIRTVKFEPNSYPNGVEVDVTPLTQAQQDMDPTALPAGLDLWSPFVGDVPLTLPYSAQTVKSDAEDVPDDGTTDTSAPPGALFFTNFTGATKTDLSGIEGRIGTSYGDIITYSLGCDTTAQDDWYVGTIGAGAPKVSINGYHPSAANLNENCDDWLILPETDLTSRTAVTLTFDNGFNFSGPDLELFYATDYDPTADASPASATWLRLPFVVSTAGGYLLQPSGPVVINNADLPGGDKTVHFALRYTADGRDAGDGKIWEVDNIAIVDGAQTGIAPVVESFDAGTGVWQVVNTSSVAWQNANVGGRPSAKAGDQGTSSLFSNADTWLVSPAWDIPSPATDLDFVHSLYFSGTTTVPAAESLRLYVDDTCTLSGNYALATVQTNDWTLLKSSFSGSPDTWNAQAAIAMSAYAGDTVCFAFRFRANAGDSRYWAVDDAGAGEPPVVVNDTVPGKPSGSNIVRIASFNTLLANRPEDNSSILADDLNVTTDGQAQGVAEIIQRIDPDVILINEFDYDAAGLAISRFKTNYLQVSQNGQTPITYPYHYIATSNTGTQPEDELGAAFDCDFNDSTRGCGEGGNNDDPEDAFGFGEYPGAFAMAVLSKHPIDTANIRTFRKFLWKDMPGNVLPTSYYAPDEQAIFRLSSKSHWDVPITVNGETIHVLASHPTPPVFDDSEDRNGRRNHDEVRFWADYVARDGADCYIYDDDANAGCLGLGRRFVVMGDQNADPAAGDSFGVVEPDNSRETSRAGTAIGTLLQNPVVDSAFEPRSNGGIGTTTGLRATADFGLRADYVVPSKAGFDVRMDSCDPDDPKLDCGIYWPALGDAKRALTGDCSSSGPGCDSSDHRLVWLDLAVLPDTDDDQIPDDVDICISTADTAQDDLDRDGLGDACDPDDDGDLMDDDWETLYGLNPFDPSDATSDVDNDGDDALTEFLNGTNPLVDESAIVPRRLPLPLAGLVVFGTLLVGGTALLARRRR